MGNRRVPQQYGSNEDETRANHQHHMQKQKRQLEGTADTGHGFVPATCVSSKPSDSRDKVRKSTIIQ